MAPKVPSFLGIPFSSSSKSQTSAVIDIIKVNNPPIPKANNGIGTKMSQGILLPGSMENQDIPTSSNIGFRYSKSDPTPEFKLFPKPVSLNLLFNSLSNPHHFKR